MAFHCATSADYLQRTTGLLPASGNSTVCFWAKFPTVATSPAHQVAYTILDNPAVYTQYTAIYANSTNSILQGTGPLTVNGTAPTAATWVHYAWTQNGTTQRLYINGTSIGTFTLNRAAFVNGFELMGADTITAQTDVTVAYVREWTAALTAGQVQAEMLTTSAAHATNLYMDCPLESDLLDDSGGGHDWTQIGAGSFVAGPAPTNNSAATAIAITSFPYSASQMLTPIMDAWYSYTATEDATIDVFGFGDLTNYQPYQFVYSPTSTAFYLTISDSPVANVPLQFPVVTGVTYWFRFTSSTSFTGTGTLTISAETAPTGDIPYGSILVNDDAAGFSAAVLSSVDGDDNHVYQFINDIAQGDGGDILSGSHNILLADAFDGTLVQYSGDLSTILTTLTFGAGSSKVLIRANQTTQTYYAGQRIFSAHPQFQKITDAGLMTAFATLSSNGMSAFAVSDDEATIFLSGNTLTTSSNVRQWDVAGVAFGADLVAAVANHRVTDMLLMTDSTLLVMYIQTFSPGDIYVKRYDSTTGATLNTYTLETGVTIPTVSVGYRLAFAIDDPVSFWVWYHVTDGGSFERGVSKFRNVRISDGVVLSTTQQVEFENGVYAATPADAPLARFGPSSSCPFLILREAVVIPAEPQTFPIRRERIFRHLSEEQQWIFYQWLQIDAEAGVGLSEGQGRDPQIILQWSDDGGHTWSNEHFLSAGRMGEYTKRPRTQQIGRSRDRVFKVAMSDPVKWALLSAYFGAEKGTS